MKGCLGHVVGGGYVKPGINKVEAVEPKTKKEVGHSWDLQVTADTSLKSMLPCSSTK